MLFIRIEYAARVLGSEFLDDYFMLRLFHSWSFQSNHVQCGQNVLIIFSL
jgi:hypothetical protein